jgi:hypothetical protein
MEQPQLPKLSAQEKLDAVYEFKMRLFRGLVAHMIFEDIDLNAPEIGVNMDVEPHVDAA